jgi:hypothetical protein
MPSVVLIHRIERYTLNVTRKINFFSPRKQEEFRNPALNFVFEIKEERDLIFVPKDMENKNPLCSVPKHKTEGMPALESSTGG